MRQFLALRIFRAVFVLWGASTLVFIVLRLSGAPVGILSALRRNGLYDAVAMAAALVGQSAPTFFVGIVLILIFSVQFQLLPAGGRGEWFQLILPVVTLAAFNVASIARLTRSAMLEVMGRDFIRTARAKGLSETAVLVHHAVKNF